MGKNLHFRAWVCSNQFQESVLQGEIEYASLIIILY